MTILHVTIVDMYSRAYFNISVPVVTADAIIRGIEDKYSEVRKRMARIGTGNISVSGKGVKARGTIMWLWDGRHTIRMEAPRLVQDESTSVCQDDCPPSERTYPTCCGFV